MKLFRCITITGLLATAVFFSCQRQAGLDALLVEEAKVVSADGVPIHYRLYGKGDVSVLFVHDWCTNMAYWKGQIPSFAVNYRVVTLDLAGHGLSGKERRSWTMEAFAKDVAAVVEKLDLEKVVLVGHGMGGPVILEAAKLLPGRAIGLVGLNSFIDLYMKPLSENQVQHSLEPWRQDFPNQMREFVRLTYFSPNSDHEEMGKIIIDMLRTPEDAALSSLGNLLRYDGSEALRQVQLSVRCVQTDFMPASYEVAEANAKSIWVDYVEGLGHFIMLEDPLTFNRFLAGYISEFVTESYEK